MWTVARMKRSVIRDAVPALRHSPSKTGVNALKAACGLQPLPPLGRSPMAREPHDYDDIPGTVVFDAEKSRQGYGINMFCMSLMKEENRKAFKGNEAAYLKKFNLTPEQTQAILGRDYNRMLELGGNIYFTAKLGATDGHSF